MFSAAFTRFKGAISGAVSLVPIVGGVASRAISNIHTGDEHQDANGNWVSNSTGAPTMAPPSAALQAEIDRVRAFDKAEEERIRNSAAESLAKVGASLTLDAAARIGAPGNVYQQIQKANPLYIAGGAVALLVVLYLVATAGRK